MRDSVPQIICNFENRNKSFIFKLQINMAKKRIIKKSLRYIMSDLFTATLIAATDEKADQTKVEDVQKQILKVYNDYNCRLSHYENKKAKVFFKQFKEEINKEIKDLADEINGIIA